VLLPSLSVWPLAWAVRMPRAGGSIAVKIRWVVRHHKSSRHRVCAMMAARHRPRHRCHQTKPERGDT